MIIDKHDLKRIRLLGIKISSTNSLEKDIYNICPTRYTTMYQCAMALQRLAQEVDKLKDRIKELENKGDE